MGVEHQANEGGRRERRLLICIAAPKTIHLLVSEPFGPSGIHPSVHLLDVLLPELIVNRLVEPVLALIG